MKKIILGRTNENVSIISLGAWSHGKQNTSGGHNVGWSNQSDQDSINALKKSFSLGLNHCGQKFLEKTYFLQPKWVGTKDHTNNGMNPII
jgi:hypothetical protein